MLKITVLTLFPKIIESFISESIIKNAIKNKHVDIKVIDFRSYSKDKHKKVDDYQCGGGPGMVLALQPIVDAIKDCKTKESYIALTTPKGNVFNQTKAKELSRKKHIILIAGHYEGFDERINHYVDENLSIGDYVLTNGEIPSIVILDSVTRLLEGVINKESLVSESFENSLLDYPVYTKPLDFEGHKVPEILMSGNHKKINDYRMNEQIRLTKANRKDLYTKYIKSKKKGK